MAARCVSILPPTWFRKSPTHYTIGRICIVQSYAYQQRSEGKIREANMRSNGLPPFYSLRKLGEYSKMEFRAFVGEFRHANESTRGPSYTNSTQYRYRNSAPSNSPPKFYSLRKHGEWRNQVRNNNLKFFGLRKFKKKLRSMRTFQSVKNRISRLTGN